MTDRRSISILIALIAIGGGLYWYFSRPAHTVSEQVKEIIAQKDIASCEQLNGVVDKGNNYYTVCTNNIAWNAAMTKLDLSLCGRLDDVLMKRKDCEETILSRLVKSSADPSVCTSVPAAFQNECTLISERVHGADEQFVQTLLRDPRHTTCSTAPEALRADCTRYQALNIYSNAAAPGNFETCQHIANSTLQNVCRNPRMLEAYLSYQS